MQLSNLRKGPPSNHCFKTMAIKQWPKTFSQLKYSGKAFKLSTLSYCLEMLVYDPVVFLRWKIYGCSKWPTNTDPWTCHPASRRPPIHHTTLAQELQRSSHLRRHVWVTSSPEPKRYSRIFPHCLSRVKDAERRKK